MLGRRAGICLQLRECQSNSSTNPSDHLYRTQSMRTPAQRCKKEKEGTGGWLVRMIVVVDTGRISKFREVHSLPAASHRMETPIRNLDHSSHRYRGLWKSSSTPVHLAKAYMPVTSIMMFWSMSGHGESSKGSGSSSMGWESEGNFSIM